MEFLAEQSHHHKSSQGRSHQHRLVYLQRKVDKWGHEEVQRWLNNVGLAHYGNALKTRGVQGPVNLLQLILLPIALPLDVSYIL